MKVSCHRCRGFGHCPYELGRHLRQAIGGGSMQEAEAGGIPVGGGQSLPVPGQLPAKLAPSGHQGTAVDLCRAAGVKSMPVHAHTSDNGRPAALLQPVQAGADHAHLHSLWPWAVSLQHSRVGGPC